MYRVMCFVLFLASVLLASDVITSPIKAVANESTATVVPLVATSASIEEQVFSAINHFREEQHLSPLVNMNWPTLQEDEENAIIFLRISQSSSMGQQNSFVK